MCEQAAIKKLNKKVKNQKLCDSKCKNSNKGINNIQNNKNKQEFVEEKYATHTQSSK